MNKKGDLGKLLKDNVIYLILIVLFFSGMMYFVLKQRDGAKIWESYYASEIGRIIDMSKPGDEMRIDAQKAVEIAMSRGVSSSAIFSFDNAKNELSVKLSPDGATGFLYYNNVDVINSGIESGAVNNGVAILVLKIKEAGKNAGA